MTDNRKPHPVGRGLDELNGGLEGCGKPSLPPPEAQRNDDLPFIDCWGERHGVRVLLLPPDVRHIMGLRLLDGGADVR